MSGTRHLFAVYVFFGDNLGYFGKTGKHAFTVEITQSPVHLVLNVELRFDSAVADAAFGVFKYFRSNRVIIVTGFSAHFCPSFLLNF